MATILIVEDDATNRDLLMRFVQLMGYDVLVATNGAQGIALAHEKRPNLILMDMRLPLVTGWDATRQLKAHEDTCTIPIIALTAYAFNEDRVRALESGCDDYETKPIEFTRLFNKVAAHLHSV